MKLLSREEWNNVKKQRVEKPKRKKAESETSEQESQEPEREEGAESEGETETAQGKKAAEGNTELGGKKARKPRHNSEYQIEFKNGMYVSFTDHQIAVGGGGLPEAYFNNWVKAMNEMFDRAVTGKFKGHKDVEKFVAALEESLTEVNEIASDLELTLREIISKGAFPNENNPNIPAVPASVTEPPVQPEEEAAVRGKEADAGHGGDAGEKPDAQDESGDDPGEG